MAESKSTIRQRNLRCEIVAKLGGRCSNPDCRWHNDDGTRGCTDIRALQIDHVGGGGSMELRAGHGVGLAHLYRVRLDLKYSALTGIAGRLPIALRQLQLDQTLWEQGRGGGSGSA